jgi:ribosomal protein S19
LAIPRKTHVYLGNKYLSLYYSDPRALKQKKFIWDRNPKTSLFLIYRTYLIHKGMYWRRAVLTPTNLGAAFGTHTLTRKPLAHPIKKEKKKKFG